MADKPRVQAPEVRDPVPFRPTPVQSSTYVRPVNPGDTSGNLRRLADALGPLNAALIAYGSSAKKDEQAPSRWTGMTNEEVHEEIKKGGVEVETSAAQSTWGGRLFAEFQRSVDAKAETELEKYGGNYEAFLRGEANVFMQEKGMSKAAAHTFSTLVERWAPSRQAEWSKAKTEQDRMSVYENLPANYDNIINQLRTEGKSPNDIAKAVWAAEKENVARLKLDPLKSEKVVMERINKAAVAGDVELFNALVDDTRGGLGPVSKKASNLTAIEKLRGFAAERKRENDLKSNWLPASDLLGKVQRGEATEADINTMGAHLNPAQKASYLAQSKENRERAVEAATKEATKNAEKLAAIDAEHTYLTEGVALAQSGRFNELTEREIPNGSGGMRKITPQNVADRYVTFMGERVAAGEMTQEDADNAMTKFFTATGLENPAWKRTLNVGAANAATANITNKEHSSKEQPPLTPAAKGGFTLFKQLKASNPGVLARQGMTEDASKLWERAARIQDVMDIDDEQAILEAQKRIAYEKQNGGTRLDLGLRDEDVFYKIKNSRSFWFAKGNEDNLTAFIAPVREIALEAMRDGRSKDEAVAEGVKWLQDNHIHINGSLVRITGQLPTDAEKLFNGLLEEYAKAYGKDEGIDSADDLTLMHVPNENRWLVVNKKTRLPVHSGPSAMWSLGVETMSNYRTFKASETAKSLKEGNWFDYITDQLSRTNSAGASASPRNERK